METCTIDTLTPYFIRFMIKLSTTTSQSITHQMSNLNISTTSTHASSHSHSHHLSTSTSNQTSPYLLHSTKLSTTNPDVINPNDTHTIKVDIPFIQSESPLIYQSARKYCLFYSKSIPEIKLSDYILRIIKYANVSIDVLIQSSVYIFRIAQKVIINQFTIHRLLVTCILVSLKLLIDVCPNNLFMSSTIKI